MNVYSFFFDLSSSQRKFSVFWSVLDMLELLKLYLILEMETQNFTRMVLRPILLKIF